MSNLANDKLRPLNINTSVSRQIGRQTQMETTGAGASDQIVSNKSSQQTNQSKTFIGEGEVLRFERVSRYDMGFYMCIATNGVLPSVSQRIFLPVSCEYQPCYYHLSCAHSECSVTPAPTLPMEA